MRRMIREEVTINFMVDEDVDPMSYEGEIK